MRLFIVRHGETLWNRVLQKVPDATEALNGLALARLDAGQLEQADAYLQRSLQADPDFEETWALRTRWAYRQGDLAAAERSLASRIFCMRSGGYCPLPISIRVPEMMRTML